MAMRVLGLVIVGTMAAACTTSTPSTSGASCRAEYALTGTFQLGKAPPDLVNNDTGNPPADGIPDIQGCWPVGTWTFALQQMTTDCAPAPAAPSSVTFVVDATTGSEPDYTFTLTKPTDFASSTVHVDGTGAGCEGVVELYGANGREEFNLHPALGAFNQNAPLSGSGEYVLMP